MAKYDIKRKTMKIKFLITLSVCFLSYSSFSQQPETPAHFKIEKNSVKDSSLLKMVRGFNEVLKARVKTSFTRHSLVLYRDDVLIDDDMIPMPIDSLYKYNLKDFKKITISFDDSPALYGGKTEAGIIRIHRKDKP
jgi:hypothetical protein